MSAELKLTHSQCLY